MQAATASATSPRRVGCGSRRQVAGEPHGDLGLDPQPDKFSPPHDGAVGVDLAGEDLAGQRLGHVDVASHELGRAADLMADAWAEPTLEQGIGSLLHHVAVAEGGDVREALQSLPAETSRHHRCRGIAQGHVVHGRLPSASREFDTVRRRLLACWP